MADTDRDVTAEGDVTADTAHFRAFATRRDDDLPAPWKMRAGGSKIGVLAIVLVVAVILGVILGVILVG